MENCSDNTLNMTPEHDDFERDSLSPPTSTPKRERTKSRMSLESRVVRTLSFDESGGVVLADIVDLEKRVKSAAELPANCDEPIDDRLLDEFHFAMPEPSDLAQQLERESARRHFCESRIVALQRNILDLEQEQFAQSQSSAKKSAILNGVGLMLDKIKSRVSQHTLQADDKIAHLTTSNAQMVETVHELENAQKRLRNENAELKTRLSEFTRQMDASRDETKRREGELNLIISERDELNKQYSKLSAEHESTKKNYETKITNVKKLLELERAKVAKTERDGAAHEKKTKAIQQQFELVKLQTEQAKNAREQQSRLLNAEKEARVRMQSDLEGRIKEREREIEEREKEIKELHRVLENGEATTNRLRGEIDAAIAENKLVAARAQSDAATLEQYHAALLENKLEEKCAESRAEVEKLVATQQDYERNTRERIRVLEETHERQIRQLEQHLKAQYQKEIKNFLENHFNQGLSAITVGKEINPRRLESASPAQHVQIKQSTAISHRRSSSPVSCQPPIPDNFNDISEIESLKCSSKKADREKQLKHLIEQVLRQKPIESEHTVGPSGDSNSLHSQLLNLSRSETLSEREKSSVAKLCRIISHKAKS